MVDVRIYSDAVAKFRGEFVVELKGRASEVLSKALQVADEINGLERLAMVAAIRASGDQLRGKTTVSFFGKNGTFEIFV